MYVSKEEFEAGVEAIEAVDDWGVEAYRFAAIRSLMIDYQGIEGFLGEISFAGGSNGVAKRVLLRFMDAGVLEGEDEHILLRLMRELIASSPIDFTKKATLNGIILREELSAAIAPIGREEVDRAYQSARTLWQELPACRPRSLQEAIETILGHGSVEPRPVALHQLLTAAGADLSEGAPTGIRFLAYLADQGLTMETLAARRAKMRENVAARPVPAAEPIVAVVFFPPRDDDQVKTGLPEVRKRMRVKVYGLGVGNAWRDLLLVSFEPMPLPVIRRRLRSALRSAINTLQGETGKQPRIDFFLPYHLMDQRVDKWRIDRAGDGEPEPIGILHRVVVRCANRWYRGMRREVMEPLWEQPLWTSEELRAYQLAPAGCKPLYALLDEPRCCLFVCETAVRRHGISFWQDVQESAVPYGLWARRSTRNPAFRVREALEARLLSKGDGPETLPQRVLALRRKAINDPNARIGAGVSLYFESKDHWPPSHEETPPPNRF